MVQTKRGVPSKAATPAASKAAKLDPAVKEAKEVIRRIRAPTDFRLIQDRYNYESMEMLSQMFPLAVSFKEDRNKYQEGVFNMMGGVISELEKALKQTIVSAESSVVESSEKRDGLQASLATVQANHAEKKQDLNEKKGSLAQDAMAFGAAKEAKQSALRAQHEGGKNQVALEARFVEAQRVVTELVAPLAAGTHEDKSTAISTLLKLLPDYDIDKSMLTALPSALSKALDERGQFDGMAVAQLVADMDKRLESLRAEVAKGEPAKQERAAAVEAAQAEFEAAKARQVVSADAFTQCQKEMKEQDEALAAAEYEVVSLERDVNRSSKAVETAKARLSKFEEGTKAKFLELQNRAAPTPEPQAPAPAAETLEAATAPGEGQRD